MRHPSYLPRSQRSLRMKETAIPRGKSPQVSQERAKRRYPKPVYYYSNEKSPDFCPHVETLHHLSAGIYLKDSFKYSSTDGSTTATDYSLQSKMIKNETIKNIEDVNELFPSQKLALDLHVNFCIPDVFRSFFFEASDWVIYSLLVVVLASRLSN